MIKLKNNSLLIIGYICFLVSLVLPAIKTSGTMFGSEPTFFGFTCLFITYLQIPDFFKFDHEAYSSILAFANTIMIFFPLLVISQKVRKNAMLFILMVICTLFVVFTPVSLKLLSGSDLYYLIGFYFWALSFILCTIYLAKIRFFTNESKN